jgi:hypothetical protein
MKRLIITLLSLSLLAFVPMVRANLGDTMQESVLKYGPASATGSPQILVYIHPPFRIWQTFDDTGHCSIAEFSPLDRATPFTAAQCAELDASNLPAGLELGVGPGWERVPWTGGIRGRHTLSYEYTGKDGTLFQAIVGESRDDENSRWYDDRLYLNAAGIKVFKSSGKAGGAQAPAGYQDDYNVQHLNLRSYKTGKLEPVVGYTSALDGQWHHVSPEQYAQAQASGVKLGRLLANRAAQGLPPQSLDESRVEVAGDGMKIFGHEAIHVKFYIDTALASAWAEMKRIDALLTTRSPRLNNAEASAAMDLLQDTKGLPRVKGGVWYDVAADTYNWIGPKFGHRMSEPANQFLVEVEGPLSSSSYPPSITKADTDWARANAARIEAENAKRAATLDPEAMARSAHDAAIRADNERVLKALQQLPPAPAQQ